eukprot:GHVU01125176.1.p1 GENE.GHVU01125176.1~~GHVU01125176.1.p1  ORF type:complete len:115 (-),score=2.95 GHVU01125176.1:163-507(-)
MHNRLESPNESIANALGGRDPVSRGPRCGRHTIAPQPSISKESGQSEASGKCPLSVLRQHDSGACGRNIAVGMFWILSGICTDLDFAAAKQQSSSYTVRGACHWWSRKGTISRA